MASVGKWISNGYIIYWAHKPPKEITDIESASEHYDLQFGQGGTLVLRVKGSKSGGFFVIAPHMWSFVKTNNF